MLWVVNGRWVAPLVASMKKILASILTTILIVAMTLAAMFILLQATIFVTAIRSPLERAGAIVAELLLGVILLLGTVWMATHLAVRIFSTPGVAAEDEPNVTTGRDT
jgi:hypothetical protein